MTVLNRRNYHRHAIVIVSVTEETPYLSRFLDDGNRDDDVTVMVTPVEDRHAKPL